MGLGVLGLGVVQVVGRDERDVEVLGEAQQLALGLPLDGDAVVHDLGEEVLLAEQVLELAGGLAGLVVLAEPQPGLDLAADAASGRDEPVGVLGEELAVDARLEVVPLQRGQRAHPEEVVHAAGGPGEQRHVGVCATATDVVAAGAVVAPAGPGLVAAVGAGGEVGLDADDRLDAVGAGLGPELVGAEDVAVVGRRDGRHAHLGGALEQLVDARGAVEHRVLGMHVQVREAGVLSGGGGHERTHFKGHDRPLSGGTPACAPTEQAPSPSRRRHAAGFVRHAVRGDARACLTGGQARGKRAITSQEPPTSGRPTMTSTSVTRFWTGSAGWTCRSTARSVSMACVLPDRQVRDDVVVSPLVRRMLGERGGHRGRQRPERLGRIRRQPQDLVLEPGGRAERRRELRHGRDRPGQLGVDVVVEVGRVHEGEQHRDVSGYAPRSRLVEHAPVVADDRLGLGDADDHRAVRRGSERRGRRGGERHTGILASGARGRTCLTGGNHVEIRSSACWRSAGNGLV